MFGIRKNYQLRKELKAERLEVKKLNTLIEHLNDDLQVLVFEENSTQADRVREIVILRSEIEEQLENIN